MQIRITITAAIAAVVVATSACVAVRPEQLQAAPATGKPRDAVKADEVVFARRILMAGIAHNMEEIAGIGGAAGNLDLAEAREHAAEISTMLLAFPHLFPPESNTWSKELENEDTARVSFARSEVWKTFDDFYGRAEAASRTALEGSRAKNAAEFRRLAQDLQQQCDACHAKYRRY